MVDGTFECCICRMLFSPRWWILACRWLERNNQHMHRQLADGRNICKRMNNTSVIPVTCPFFIMCVVQNPPPPPSLPPTFVNQAPNCRQDGFSTYDFVPQPGSKYCHQANLPSCTSAYLVLHIVVFASYFTTVHTHCHLRDEARYSACSFQPRRLSPFSKQP